MICDSRLADEKRKALSAISLVAALTLAGCSAPSQEPSGEAAPSSSSSLTTSAPATGRDSAFSPLTSVVDFWKKYPEIADARSKTGMLLINEKGTRTEKFVLSDAEAKESVMVVLICDSESNYKVTLGNGANPKLAETSGGSCGGPMINTYTTAPHDSSKSNTVPDFIQVEVPSGVNFYVTAFGVDGT